MSKLQSFKIIKGVLKKSDIVQATYNILIKLIRKAITCFSVLVSIDSKKVLLQSYEGRQYSCNPKYIAQYLKKYSNLRLVISLQHPEQYDFLKKMGYETVKSNSLTYFYHYITSKIVVCNDSLPMLVPLKNKQVSINTWHGGGAYKKVGISLSKTNYYSQRYIWKHKVDYMISSCKSFSELAIEAFAISEEGILPIGMPRNDMLVKSSNAQDIIQKVKGHYGINKEKKIVLYAPTYRESMLDSLYGLDFECVLDKLEERFGCEWVFLFRGHYFLSDSKKFNCKSFINASEYDDMQELLCAADCLITDYSSSVWDFSLTYKPCFLYATDLEEYKKEIDFYYPIEKWPFALGQSNDELLNNITNFDEAEYIEKVKQHHKALGSYEDGHATERACKLIEKICSEEKLN